MQLVVADYIQSELQLKAGRDKGDLHELDGRLLGSDATLHMHQVSFSTNRRQYRRYCLSPNPNAGVIVDLANGFSLAPDGLFTGDSRANLLRRFCRHT